VEQVTRIGMDTSKRFFQLHGVDASERVVLRRQLTRTQMLPFFAKLPATIVAMEACGASHHWAPASSFVVEGYEPPTAVGEQGRRQGVRPGSGFRRDRTHANNADLIV
jgi:transposase